MVGRVCLFVVENVKMKLIHFVIFVEVLQLRPNNVTLHLWSLLWVQDWRSRQRLGAQNLLQHLQTKAKELVKQETGWLFLPFAVPMIWREPKGHQIVIFAFQMLLAFRPR